jgi:hypothetical protein
MMLFKNGLHKGENLCGSNTTVREEEKTFNSQARDNF